MITRKSAVLISSVGLILDVSAKDVVLFSFNDLSTGMKTEGLVSEELFSKQPTWNGSGKPPMSMETAIEKGRGSIQGQSGYTDKRIQLRSVWLRPPVKDSELFPHRYVYIVEFQVGESRPAAVILMSGDVVPLRTTPIPKQ